jgi:hypothetical protein
MAQSMQVLSGSEAVEWCRASGVKLSARDLPDASDCDRKCEIPSDAGARVALVHRVMESFRDESSFLVWFDDWSVWPSGQRMHVFDRVRMSYGETRPLIEAPAHLFDQSEIEDAISFVTVAILFLWDCYVVNPDGTKLLYLSHDEYALMRGDVDVPDWAGHEHGRH